MRFITHPSHIMGIVEDETCCIVCYADPWMAIVEDECGLGSSASAGASVPEDTRSMVRHLYAAGMPTREIAARAGLSPTTVGKIARAAGMRRQGGRPRKGEAARMWTKKGGE